MYEHLLEFLVSNWSVPKRPFIFGGVAYVAHVVTVITDAVPRGDAWLTLHADTSNQKHLTQQTLK